MRRDDLFLKRWLILHSYQLKNHAIRWMTIPLLSVILASGTVAPNSSAPLLPAGIAHAHEKMSPWKVDSSVKVPEDVLKQAISEARTAFNRILSPYAKISLAQAHKIAQDSQPQAVVKDISLQTIRQNLVYVAVLSMGDTRQLTVIDAGNGKILATRLLNVRKHMHEREQGNLMY